MCYGQVCSVGSATRPHAANCVAIFPWASSGVSRMARSASTPTNPCAPPSRPSLLASLSSDRYVASGYGSVARVCRCPCGCTTALKSAGSTQATSPSIISSPIRSTQAPTHMARAVMRSPSTRPAYARSARKRRRAQWQVFIPNHHEGFIDWNTYEANRARITANTHPRPHQSGSGAVREGTALLQGIAVCGRCGRKLRTHYTGRTASAGYHCAGKDITNGRGIYCLTIGALQVDEAVERAVLAALAPIGVEAAIAAAERLEADHDGALAQWRLTVERASYETQRAERRYRAVDPDNRLVARGLEAEWEKALRELDRAKAELAHREALRPKTLSANERCRLLALGTDLSTVWRAPTTLPRDKKELLRTVLEEVIITVHKEQHRAHLTLRWRGSALTEIDLDLPRRRATVRTDEDTIALLRRLATHYPDAVIAGILNRQERRTAYGHRFTANLVSGLRRQWNIARYERPTNPPDGELMNVTQIANTLGVAASTIHRWLNDGIIAGEQITPGAPWRIRLTDDLRARVAEEVPQGYLTMYQTMRLLGVSRQTILQRVKRGEIQAIHVKQGRKKGLRLKVIRTQTDLFNQTS